MASIEDNKKYYEEYEWPNDGQEWSIDWGSTFNFWYGSILPRIGMFLPARRIVEIGCGRGRISRYLGQNCDNLVLLDLAENCVEYCQTRFKRFPHIDVELTSGCNLLGVESNSTDLLFSIHSLVHSDAETIRSYLFEAGRVLSKQGVFFIHHSNGHAYLNDPIVNQKELSEYRDTSVSGALVSDWAEEAGLSCIRQEFVNWGIESIFSDCFSILVRKERDLNKTYQGFTNAQFCKEMQNFKKLSDHYQTFEIIKQESP